MARIHDLVAYRQTVGELIGYSSPLERILLAPLACVVKLLRLPPGPLSCDDPPVDRIDDLQVAPNELPQKALAKFEPVAETLKSFRFQPSVCYAIWLPNLQTEIYQMYLRRPDGQVVARITYRHWLTQEKHRLFVSFFSTERSGTTILTTNGALDCHQPPEVHVERQRDEPVAELLARHEEAVRKEQVSPLCLATDAAVQQFAEEFHEKFLQYQLRRGTYAPLREQGPQAVRKVRPAPKAVAPISSGPAADPFAAEAEYEEVPEHDGVTDDIVRLMEKETTKKSSFAGNLLLLLVSLGVFIAVSKGQNDWSWTWLLIPALLVHEVGHLLAMRICAYHNTKIFFIPFLGAAASGVNFNVPGWKRVLVALAGPVPGLALGILAGIAGMVYDQPLLTRFGGISCILNAFNLLPVMPLDGGWVAFHILFCRHPLLDAAFRGCGAFGLFFIAIATKQGFLGVLGFFILMGAYRAFKAGDVARRLLAEGVKLASEDTAVLDHDLATRAADATRRAYANSPRLANKVLAMTSLEVYTLLHARPPGVLATLFFGGVLGGGLLAGVVASFVFMMADQGKVGQFLQAAARQPAHAYACGSSAEWPGENAQISPQETVQIEAFCESDAAAQKLFGEFRQEPAATGRLRTVGPYVFINLPAGNDALREREIERLTERNVKFNVVLPESGMAHVRIMALARSADESESIISELENFSRLGTIAELIPPWSARWRAGGAQIDGFRKARAAFLEMRKADQNPDAVDLAKMKERSQQEQTARRLGRREEARKIAEETAQMQDDSRRAAMEKVLADAGPEKDAETMRLYLEWHSEVLVGRRKQRQQAGAQPGEVTAFEQYKLASFRALQARLGAVSKDDLETARVAARHLYVSHTGLVMEIHWMQLVNDGDGLSSLLEWFCQHQCTNIKFEVTEAQFDLADGLEE